MKLSEAAEFFFLGACLLPPLLLATGEAGFSILAFVALIVAAGVCSIGDPQAPCRKPPSRR